MNNELFVSLYDSLSRKLAFDIQDATAVRGVRVIQKAVCHKRVPVILCEAVAKCSAVYDAYYPLDEASYREALPRCGILRLNQINAFNNQLDARITRIYDCGLDWRGGVFYIYCSLTLSAPTDDELAALKQLFYFFDVFASCLSLQLNPVYLDGSHS